MKDYFIKDFTVTKLWGAKNYAIRFQPDVNVIIGPNASGKTTLINILYDILNFNVARLSRTDFESVTLRLRAVDKTDEEIIEVVNSKGNLQFKVAGKTTKVPANPSERYSMQINPEGTIQYYTGPPGREYHTLKDKLKELVPAVWLPVSRRLPIGEEEEIARRPLHKKPLESVDECLSSLVEDLHRYRLSLNVELSELRKDFQRQALMNILFDKHHDRKVMKQFATISPLTPEDKLRFVQAFKDVGMVDKDMEARITEHFDASVTAAETLRKTVPGQGYTLEDLMIVPLISRTRAIVETAQKLEDKRTLLFTPINSYIETVNTFLNEKAIAVTDRGELEVLFEVRQKRKVDWRHLSSGEKQILILLTQALLSAKTPHVYVADEPELSLHVTWQEKLLKALTTIAGNCQFIVATHSPDITAGFGDKVINLAHL